MSGQWNWFRGRQYFWSSDGRTGGTGGGGIPPLFYILFIGIGLIFLGVGLASAASTRAFIAKSETAQGTVVRYEQRRDDEGSLLNYPVVRFNTPDGTAVELRSNTGSSFRLYGGVGARVKVLYPPADPQAGQIATFMELWFLAAMFFGFGVVFPLIGIGVWLVNRARPARQWSALPPAAPAEIMGDEEAEVRPGEPPLA